MTRQQSFDLALQHHRAGRLQEAEATYLQILLQEPGNAQALHLLGVLAGQRGHLAAAADLFRKAIAAKPAYPEAWFDLGQVLMQLGRPADAIPACRQAIAIKPGFPPAHYVLGNALRANGQPQDAMAAYRQATALWPTFAEAHLNLGIVLHQSGQLTAAIAEFRRAIAARPTFAEALNNLGINLKESGQFDEAVSLYRRAIAASPDYAEAHFNLGKALVAQEKIDEAMAAYRQAIALKPAFAEAITNLGSALKEVGNVAEALAAFRRAIEVVPDSPDPYRNLLYTLHFSPDHDAEAIAEEHRRWNRRIVEPILKTAQPHGNVRSPDRGSTELAEVRLRIGYVSGTFRNHVLSHFTIPLLSHHDRTGFEVFCYSSVEKPDRFTQQIAGLVDVWRDARQKSDEELCQLVRDDRIDILIDLELHMADGRPLALARKPAPVQVAWLGYPGTTGSSAMDYVLSDPWLAPPDADRQYAERIIRLPETFWCYDPLEERDLPVGPLPAVANGLVTFSCLNNFCKVNEPVIRLWSAVLRAVPASRLILLSPQGSHRQRTLGIFEREQVAADRIEFVSFQPRRQYMQTYARADIGLDTFPYTGHTTSLDSFYMGVPVVTLAGQAAVGRAGVCQLMNLGMPDLIAATAEQYVQIAAGLAGDLPSLSQLRSALRQRMQASPLMDAPRFARNIECAYRQMWREWYAAPGAEKTGR